MSRQSQAVINFVRLVQVGIIDQALPAHCGSRFFKVDPHDEAEILRELFNRSLQQTSVFARGFGVVNRTGPNHYQQTPALTTKDFADLLPRMKDGRRGLLGRGQLLLEKYRRKHDFSPLDTQVIGSMQHSICTKRWTSLIRTGRPLVCSPNLTAPNTNAGCRRFWMVHAVDAAQATPICDTLFAQSYSVLDKHETFSRGGQCGSRAR